jgi:hypothetical protein
MKRSGLHLVLKEVTSDSRCPQGLNCIWAGEAQVIVLCIIIKLVEDVAISFSPSNGTWKIMVCEIQQDKYKRCKV